MYVCMYVCVSARARARACVCVYNIIYINMRLLHASHLGKVGLYVGFHVLLQIEHPSPSLPGTQSESEPQAECRADSDSDSEQNFKF